MRSRCRIAGASPVIALALAVPLLAQDAPEPEAAPDRVTWRSVHDGQAESRATGRPVLYFFTADWCPPCEALKRTVFSDPAVADLIEANYVPVEVNDILDANQESLPEVEALKFKFLVGRLPSLVVAHTDGGPAVSEEGAPVHSKMVRFLETAALRLAELERVFRAKSAGKPPPR